MKPELETEVLKILPAVKNIAKKKARNFKNAVLDEDDLTQVGVLGLMESSEKFEKEKGNKFWTFASRRCNGAMVDEQRKIDHLSRKMRRMVQSGEIKGMKEVSLRTRNFEEKDENKYNDPLSGDNLHLQSGDLPVWYWQEIFDLIRIAFRPLKIRERLIIRLYWIEGLSLKEVGKVLSLSEASIGKLVIQAMSAMKESLTNHNLVLPSRD